MSRLALALVLFVVAFHVAVFVAEALLWMQPVYNLFLALAGVAGLLFLRRGRSAVGYTLVGYMCLSALGAGIVLAASTRAYAGAFLQAVPAAAALALLLSGRSRKIGEKLGT